MSENVSDFLLFLHLIAAITWIGPALGAWSYVLQNQLWKKREPGPRDMIDDWVLSEFLRVVTLEHFGFVLLITTGILRAHALGLTGGHVLGPSAPYWLELKLWVVALIIIPFEFFDVWLAHWVIPARMASRTSDPAAFEKALKGHDLVVWFGSLVLGGAIPTVLYCVTYRPM
jgi:hypothetical protein